MATKSSTHKLVAKKTTTNATHVTKLSTVKAVSATKKTTLFSSPLKTAPFIGALVAEFIGTFLLAGAVIAGQGQPIIVMFAIAGVVLLVGTLSGSHLNPAITFGAWLTKKVSALRAAGYIVAQVLGAWFAYAVLSAFVHGAAPLSSAAQAYGQTGPTLFQALALPAGKEWYIFFAELLGAVILGLVMATAFRYKKDRVAYSLTVGFGIFVALLLAASAAAYVGGTAVVNPAVAVSLGAIKWSVWPLATYILAPMIGASVGFILHDILRVESDGGND